MFVSCLNDTFCDADPEKMVKFLIPITSVKKDSKLEEIYANELIVGGVSVSPASGEEEEEEEEEERHSVCMDPEAGDSDNLFSKDPVTACAVSWRMHMYVCMYV